MRVKGNKPKVNVIKHGCPASCNYTGECWASFFRDEPCRRDGGPSEDWIRAQIPSHLKKGNL